MSDIHHADGTLRHMRKNFVCSTEMRGLKASLALGIEEDEIVRTVLGEQLRSVGKRVVQKKMLKGRKKAQNDLPKRPEMTPKRHKLPRLNLPKWARNKIRPKMGKMDRK